jgi:hypothetical protein
LSSRVDGFAAGNGYDKAGSRPIFIAFFIVPRSRWSLESELELKGFGLLVCFAALFAGASGAAAQNPDMLSGFSL